jgi:Ohr subfamily peroxiredoxin
VASYTTTVTTVGEGRHGGRSTSEDGNLDVKHAFPVELGGSGDGTNPEQLLGAGWSACFRGALDSAARQRQIKLGDVDVTAVITLHAENNDYWLSAVLEASASAVHQATLVELMEDAHQLCPYSKATRGNIEVVLVAKAA